MDTSTPVDAAASAVQEQNPNVMAWIGLGVLVLLGFVSYLDRQIIALMVSPIERDLHISDMQIGLLQGAAFGLVYPLFAIPLGYAADRYSRRWVIFWSVCFWAVAAMLSGLANSFTTLLAARIGVGLGEGAVGPAVASLLSDIFPKRRLATVFSIYASGVILGSAGALVIGGAVIAWAGAGIDVPILGHLVAWQIAFIVTGAPALLLAFLVLIVPEPKRTSSPGAAAAETAPWSEVFAFLRQTWKFLTCYIVGQCCLSIVTLGAMAWLPIIMERTYGWNTLQIGAMLGLFIVIFGFPGQMANGVIVDKLFQKHDDAHMRYYAFASVIVTLSGGLAPLAPTPLLYLAITAPLKILLNYAGVFLAALQIVTPSRVRGRVNALGGIIIALVSATIGPSAVAFFTDNVFHDPTKVAWSLALTTVIVVPIAGIAFTLALKPMRDAVARERAHA